MSRGGVAAGLRVLMLNSETTWRGGENQAFLLLRGLREAEGVHVELAAPPGSALARRAAEIGVPSLPLPIRGGMDLVAAYRLRQVLRRGRFDLVHSHASHAHGVAFLARALSRWRDCRPPFLVVSRRVDFPFPRHGPSALKYRYGADLYLAISTGVRDVLVQCGVEAERIAMVPSGIDLARHRQLGDTTRLRRELGLGNGAVVVGNVAALAPHKAQEDFLRAARLVADAVKGARFLLVGEGSERPHLEALIRELDLSGQVTLTGFRDDALEILSLFDCFVLSSTLEGLCTSIMDAQVLGVPVVATRTGGVPDLVQDGDTGLLVPPREPEQLAAAILRLLRDPVLRSRCVAAARARAEQYGYERMVQGTLAAYRSLLPAG